MCNFIKYLLFKDNKVSIFTTTSLKEIEIEVTPPKRSLTISLKSTVSRINQIHTPNLLSTPFPQLVPNNNPQSNIIMEKVAG